MRYLNLDKDVQDLRLNATQPAGRAQERRGVVPIGILALNTWTRWPKRRCKLEHILAEYRPRNGKPRSDGMATVVAVINLSIPCCCSIDMMAVMGEARVDAHKECV